MVIAAGGVAEGEKGRKAAGDRSIGELRAGMEPGLSTAHSRRASRASMQTEAGSEGADPELKTQGTWGAVVGQIWESVREDSRLDFRCCCFGPRCAPTEPRCAAVSVQPRLMHAT
jgi:hypothetical protein